MNQFITKYAPLVTAITSGFDRIVFQGSLRYWCCFDGMERYLRHKNISLKNYRNHVDGISKRVKEASIELAVNKALNTVFCSLLLFPKKK